MKILNGLELGGFIKERQAKQVRALRQAHKIFPKLTILRTSDSPVIDVYVRLKRNYGEDILIDVEERMVEDDQLVSVIEELNNDPSIHGIIVQLPLKKTEFTQAAVDAVSPSKDVDGLSANHTFTPATALAINWLITGYNINLENKKIVIVGNGRLVGAPLYNIWKNAGLDVTVCDKSTKDLKGTVSKADIIVTATGVPSLITSDMVKNGAVVVDAGTASEHGKIVGDVAEDVRQRDDITITPIKGGVGPLTVSALFDNVINAALKIANSK